MNIVWLEDPSCVDTRLVGGKAAKLSQIAAEFRVPPGFCLTTEALASAKPDLKLSDSLSAEIEKAYEELQNQNGGPFSVAVRSSATDEDGRNDSFAGQHETILNVRGYDNVRSAIETCWHSAFSEQAMAYRSRRGLSTTQIHLAVLIQKMINADAAAVVFSVNPITGDEDEVVINASWGVGESIVGGLVTPDTIILNKTDLSLKSRQIAQKQWMTVRQQQGTREVIVPRFMQGEPSVCEEQAQTMGRLALDLESFFGESADVECAFEGGQVYTLQCRPVTTNHPVDEKEPEPIDLPDDFPVVWDDPADAKLNWSRDPMHSPYPETPLELDMDVVIEGMNLAFAYYGNPFRLRSKVFSGHFYFTGYQTGPTSQLKAMGEKALRHVKASAIKLQDLWEGKWLPEIHHLLGMWDQFDQTGSTNTQLAEHINESLELERELWNLHFQIVRPVYCAMNMFQELYEDLFDDAGPFDAMVLCQGFNNKTLETSHRLWDLSQDLSSEMKSVFETESVTGLLSRYETKDLDASFLFDFDQYLQTFGQRNELWGKSAPSWIEDPTPALKSLKEYVLRPGKDPRAELSELSGARERAIEKARNRISDYPSPVVESFEIWLQAAQIGTILSEDHGYWIDVGGQYRVRKVFVEAGRRFVAAQALDESNDVFFLHLSEVMQGLELLPHCDFKATVCSRKEEYQRYMGIEAPIEIGSKQAAPPDSFVTRSFKRFGGGDVESSHDPNEVRGNPGSPGKTAGPARILRSISEADKLQEGEVLVAQTTAPSWTPLFATAAAVVTDTGGLLSHCAVVAREYAIPAVVGAGDATERIKDGQVLEVDGETGIVRILTT